MLRTNSVLWATCLPDVVLTGLGSDRTTILPDTWPKGLIEDTADDCQSNVGIIGHILFIIVASLNSTCILEGPYQPLAYMNTRECCDQTLISNRFNRSCNN